MIPSIRIEQYQVAPDTVSIGGINWLTKWDVKVQFSDRDTAYAWKDRIGQMLQGEALAQPEQDARRLQIAMRQWEDWKTYALELQKKLVKYEGGSPMILNTQPEQEQEPVAWIYERARFGPTDLRGQQWRLELYRLKPWNGNGLVRNVQALYTTPPQRKPLTDAEIWQMVNDCSFNGDLHADKFARAIEAKLKEKNT